MPEKVDYGVRVLLGSDGIYELHLQPSDVSHTIQTSNISTCKCELYSEMLRLHVKNTFKSINRKLSLGQTLGAYSG